MHIINLFFFLSISATAIEQTIIYFVCFSNQKLKKSFYLLKMLCLFSYNKSLNEGRTEETHIMSRIGFFPIFERLANIYA